ncbi:K+ channel tetramerization domain protein [Necator americanus]|uniref:K+ channel tetramerization domain protein n=1 Tax=Necator americanus TaxID=51031 RepID=W2T0U8_NECAM|nr:K+ channel tetramerization domain protein [Necator americanus]ETN74597.1 K+ channel tetramerization domain protein [Necator americanus]
MADDVIELNVGGTHYSTTRQTLMKEPETLLFRIANSSSSLPKGVIRLDNNKYFIDRDGVLFSHILNYLRTEKLILPDGFKETSRLRDEIEYYEVEKLREALIPHLSSPNSLKPKLSNGGLYTGDTGGYITLGYRGTFAFGRDGQADVKFRKLHRILVCGRASLCREVFGETLNESRDPGGDDGERYTSRLYLKHQCLERACDIMAEKGFKLVATCCSGANGLAANHPVVSGALSGASQSDLMNHRNCGDFEEQRWAHYTEYVFYRENQGGTLTPSPRDL